MVDFTNDKKELLIVQKEVFKNSSSLNFGLLKAPFWTFEKSPIKSLVKSTKSVSNTDEIYLFFPLFISSQT
jgi:hypothetical protein